MSVEREELVYELLDMAADMDVSSRQKFLAECSAEDASLLSDGVIEEVHALLEAGDRAREEGFLREPLMPPEEDGAAQTLSAGQQFDGYKILSFVGAGGMGEVYLARDEELNRDIAVKLVKGGFRSRETIRRFRHERRILARLKHPNIAAVHKGGETADGTPYLVMEYVSGKPITEYARERGLSIAERLALFQKVCSAVSYAHQCLVIHRDLKPSNILVTEDGTPKLLDFGIAKLFDPTHADGTGASTETLLPMMTPEYASPEQVRLDEVTTSSDVYSLGVLLYELLTGHSPYRCKGRGPAEMARVVCEQEPERPSAAITHPQGSSATGEVSPEATSPPSTSFNRSAASERRRLRGDLDDIVLKALRKEPARRYASVGDFSEDIRRHLKGLPVTARKDTLTYRASKFAGRNKIAVTAAALILLTLVGGIIATAWEARKANLERARAEDRFNQVRELAHSVLFDYHDAIAALPGSTPVRERLAKDALKYLDNLAADAGNSASLQRELAHAYLKVGDIQGKPYNPNLGDTEGALASYRKAQTILERLSASDPTDLAVKHDLALACQDISRIETRTGDRDEALKNAGRAVELGESLAAADAENVEYRRLLSSSHLFFGQGLYQRGSIDGYRAALDNFRKGVAVSEALSASDPADTQDRYFAGVCYGHVGYALWAIGDLTGDAGSYREALDSHRKYKETMEAVSVSEPTNAEYKRALVYATADFGKSQLKTGDAAGAFVSYRRALAMFDRLMSDDPANVEARRYLANLDACMSEALAKAGDPAEALAHSRKALAIYEALRASDPTNEEDRFYLIQTHENIGDLLTERADTAGALTSYRNAAAISEAWSLAEPANIKARSLSANEYSKIGDLYAAMAADSKASLNKRKEDWRAARDWYQKSLALWQGISAQGTLSSADAGKLDEVSREIARCETMLGK